MLARSLVPGDTVYFSLGDRVPADIRLIEVGLSVCLPVCLVGCRCVIVSPQFVNMSPVIESSASIMSDSITGESSETIWGRGKYYTNGRSECEYLGCYDVFHLTDGGLGD